MTTLLNFNHKWKDIELKQVTAILEFFEKTHFSKKRKPNQKNLHILPQCFSLTWYCISTKALNIVINRKQNLQVKHSNSNRNTEKQKF